MDPPFLRRYARWWYNCDRTFCLDAFESSILIMISELHYRILKNANRELALRFEKLRKARASRDPNGIKNAEMEYFQSLQHLYAAVQDAVAARTF